SSTGSFLNVPLRQQRGNRVFLLPPELLSMPCHQVPPDAIGRLHIAIPSPFAISPESACI
ncbi:MAG: hypothetical protein ABSH46_24015, partial [Bryobacteraceae bacterium]